MMTFQMAMRQCFRKVQFYSEKTARKKVNIIISEGGPRLYVYGCTKCGNYHLTKNSGADGNVF